MILSAVIIACNQGWMVRPCLERLGFVDEIVFVVAAPAVAEELRANAFELDSFSELLSISMEPLK